MYIRHLYVYTCGTLPSLLLAFPLFFFFFLDAALIIFAFLNNNCFFFVLRSGKASDRVLLLLYPTTLYLPQLLLDTDCVYRSNALMTSANDGRKFGSRFQHARISLAKKRGHVVGIWGRRSWFSTPSAAWICTMPSYGHLPVTISQITMPNENTSAFSVYFWLLSTSGLLQVRDKTIARS